MLESRCRFRNMHEKDQKYVKVSLSRFRNMFEKDQECIKVVNMDIMEFKN